MSGNIVKRFEWPMVRKVPYKCSPFTVAAVCVCVCVCACVDVEVDVDELNIEQELDLNKIATPYGMAEGDFVR